MIKFKEKSFIEYWKEVSAVFASLLAIIVTILTIWEKLNPIVRIPALAISGIIACIYVIYRKVPSKLKMNSLQPLFESSTRKRTKILLVIFSFIFVSWPLFGYEYFYSSAPFIERINPVDPIAGGKLQIYGRNFSEKPSGIEIEFGGIKVDQYYTTDKNYLEIRVPENVISGPLHLTKKKIISPDLELFYPIVSIQKLKSDVVLLTEDIRIDNDHFLVLFSALNTNKHREITIYDIRLDVIAAENLGAPNYQQERINMGIVSLFDNHVDNTTIDLLTQPSVHLLSKNCLIKLRPMSSESFHFRMQRPEIQHHIQFIFVVSLHFYDSNGTKDKVFAGRFYNVMMGDIKGFSTSENLPLTKKSFNKLKQKYGKYFRDIEDLKECIQEY